MGSSHGDLDPGHWRYSIQRGHDLGRELLCRPYQEDDRDRAVPCWIRTRQHFEPAAVPTSVQAKVHCNVGRHLGSCMRLPNVSGCVSAVVSEAGECTKRCFAGSRIDQ